MRSERDAAREDAAKLSGLRALHAQVSDLMKAFVAIKTNGKGGGIAG